jgi:transposase
MNDKKELNGEEQSDELTIETKAKPARDAKGKWKSPNKGRKLSREARRRAQDREILKLRQAGLSVNKIAQNVQLSERTVWNRLGRFKEALQNIDKLEVWEENRGDILSAAQLTVLQTMLQEGKLDKASLSNLGYVFKILHDAGRLSRNLPTSLSASVSFTGVDLASVRDEKSNSSEVNEVVEPDDD